MLPINKETATAGTTELSEHRLQEYDYNMILKKAGLEYDSSFENKPYIDDDGDAITSDERKTLK